MGSFKNPGPSPRPFAIGMGGWTLIFGGMSSFIMLFVYPSIASLFNTPWLVTGPDPVWIYGIMLLTGVCYLAAGTAVIGGHVWGRTLFLLFEPIHIVLSYVIYLHKPYAAYLNAFNILFYGIYAWMLTLPSSNEWFAGTFKVREGIERRKKAMAEIRKSQKNGSVTAQVFGILFATGAGFFFGMMVITIGFSRHDVLNFMTPVTFMMASAVLLPGIFLWGRRRWAGLTGWTLSAAGTWAIIEGVSLVFLIQTTYWHSVASQLPPAAAAGFNYQTFATIIMGGCIVIFIGVSLLKYQYRSDEKFAGLSLEDDSETASAEKQYALTGNR